MAATLYVVATPLGNLADLTPRAADLLRQVSVVAAEDTRRTRGLLAHLGASGSRVLSFHAHSPARRRDVLLEMLRDGRDVALVTDAGTPAVSDPGAELVAAARLAGFSVVPLPGASAVTAALSASGFPADRYLFLGFVPRKGGERTRLLARAADEEWSVVLFEAPGRLAALLADLVPLAGAGRRAVVARELTKVHEEFRAGTLAELADYYSADEPRGEITVVLEGAGAPPASTFDVEEARARADALLAEGLTRREVAQRLSAALGLSRNEAYRVAAGRPEAERDRQPDERGES
ncbi:MAG TPA: 16S rRNA (cytidine(1402)-2'-O)-methyltransferase [Gemmatimonadales bacterium]|nr:16S rRNA (cytidine(1402)-2'-O)-methyltransferase [Gemmatimonadales bacterium]